MTTPVQLNTELASIGPEGLGAQYQETALVTSFAATPTTQLNGILPSVLSDWLSANTRYRPSNSLRSFKLVHPF